jgi:hypothetical protein
LTSAESRVIESLGAPSFTACTSCGTLPAAPSLRRPNFKDGEFGNDCFLVYLRRSKHRRTRRYDRAERNRRQAPPRRELVDVGRARLWAQPSEVGDLPRIIQEALDDERAAHAAVQTANPMGKDRFTSPEALKKFTDAQEAHRRAQARRRALIEMSLST